jgi:hypothetical protein
MVDGKLLAKIVDYFMKSEIAKNARVQVQMPKVKADAPRSVKLYESSAVTESGLSLVRSRACALDDWSAIRARLLGL